MAKFSSLAPLLQGKRAELDVEFKLVLHGGEEATAKCKVQPLTGEEESRALEWATEFAKARKGDPSRPDDPQYALGLMVRRIELSCKDADSPVESRAPFFDGGTEQILANLHPETIAYVHERCEYWQDLVSPQKKTMSAEELLATCIEVAEAEDDRPLERLRPGLRAIFTRTICRQLLSSLGVKSLSGLHESMPGKSSSEKPESDPRPPKSESESSK